MWRGSSTPPDHLVPRSTLRSSEVEGGRLTPHRGRMDLPHAVRRVADDQYGLVTRAQLIDAGVTVAEVRWQLGRSWRMVLPGVVALQPGPLAPRQRQSAALLYAGPSSWLAATTALDALGLRSEQGIVRCHVYVPPSSKPRTVEWVTLRRTSFLDERLVERDGLRVSCRARAVVDAAVLLPPQEGRALVIDVVQRRLVRLDDLVHWVETRESRGRRRLRAAVTEAAAGSWSLPEADLAVLLARSRVLPPLWANPTLWDAEGRRLTTPDLWCDEVAMAVMVHSRQFHAGVLDWEETVEGDGDLSTARVAVVGVTPTSIARDPAGVLRRIEAAYLALRSQGTGRPDVRATPRAGWDRPAAG
jgi:hypothetical protein